MHEKLKELWREALSTKYLAGLVLVHDLTQAIPWLAAIVVSIATASYGSAAESPLLLGAAGALGSLSILILLINFSVWYIDKRATGFRAQLGSREHLHGESERMALALQLIHDLNLSPLEITDPLRAKEITTEWLTRYLTPAMSRISAGVGLGVLEWARTEGKKGEYRLVYDSGVPEIVRSVLPKETNRDFITCLAILQQRNHHHATISDDIGQPVRVWLVAFPEEGFDRAAKAVFSTGARIVADAWRDGGPARVAALA